MKRPVKIISDKKIKSVIRAVPTIVLPFLTVSRQSITFLSNALFGAPQNSVLGTFCFVDGIRDIVPKS